MTGYPPEPWHLAGTGHLTLWRVPAGALPALPERASALTLRGQALVVTAFVTYSEAGEMAYDELLAAVLVRDGRVSAGVSITDIWVDSAASLAGGRALWGIPKDLASFDGLSARLDDDGAAIGSAAFTPTLGGVRLPFPLPGRVVQTRDGQTVASPIRASARVQRARATWDLPPDGPLAWLRAGHPVVSAVARDFRMTFGSVG